MPQLIMLRYVQPGARRPGLPEHDLDLADLLVMAERQKRTVEDIAEEATGSGLYRAEYADESEAASSEVALTDMAKVELAALADSMGLTKSGSKAELIERITEARAAAPAASDSSEGSEGKENTTEAGGENGDGDAS